MLIQEDKLTNVYSKDYLDKAEQRLVDLTRHITLGKQGLAIANRTGDTKIAAALTIALNNLELDAKNLRRIINADQINSSDLHTPMDQSNDSLFDDIDSQDNEEPKESSTDTAADTDTDDSEDADSEDTSSNEEDLDQNDSTSDDEPDADNESDTSGSDEEEDINSNPEDSESLSNEEDELEDDDFNSEDNETNQDSDTGFDSEENTSEENNSDSNQTDGASDDLNTTDSDPLSKKDERPVADPFHKQLGDGSDKIDTREANLDELINMLSGLKAQSRQAVIDKLEELHAKKLANNSAATNSNAQASESLHENFASIMDLSDDEFDAKLNEIVRLVNQVAKIDFSDDLTTRAEKIKQDLDDPDIKQALINAEVDPVRIEQAKKKQQILRNQPRLKAMEDFKLDLFRSIKRQVEMIEEDEDTFSRFAKHSPGANTIKRGIMTTEKKSISLPIINVYFDQSGSWEDRDIEVGKRALQVLRNLELQKKIQLNEYYFANHVHKDAGTARMEGGTSAWFEILQSIKDDHATNVVLMTDSDMKWQAMASTPLVVEGCVWLLWKNGIRSEEIAKKLLGKASQGNTEYSFSTSKN